MNGLELIEKYFSGKLSEVQQRELLQLIEKDEGLNKQFEFEKNLQIAIKKREFKRLEAKVKAIESTLDVPVMKKQKSLYRTLSIAASLVLFICASYFSYQYFTAPNLSELANDNYFIYPNTEVNITRDSEKDNSQERIAFEAYEKGDFNNAVSAFKRLEANYKNFYIAQSYYSLKNYDLAKTFYLKQLDENASFIAETKWYLALAYLQLNEREKAIDQLNQLIANHEFKTTEAQLILSKIE